MTGWQTATTVGFDNWFTDLDEKARIEIAAAVRVLSQFGPTLGRPLADTLKGSKYAAHLQSIKKHLEERAAEAKKKKDR